jgi:multidrug efflux system outer membrane protein
MLRNKNALLIILIIFIAGCGLLGPTYQQPEANAPKAWNSRDYLSKGANTNLPELAWWSKFNDPQLSYLIESALQNNNNIQVAVGNVKAAEGQLKQVEYSWIPTISALAGYTNATANLMNPGYGVGLLPNYSLNIFQLINSTKFATANLAAVKAAKDAVRLMVISQTSGGYFAYLGQDYLLTLQKQLVADLADLLRLSKIEYSKGLISLYTLQSYEQQYEKAAAQVPILQDNVVVSQNTLRLLLNQNPGKIKQGQPFMNVKSNNIIPVNLPSQVLRNRPDVQQSEQQLVAANANIGVATSTFFPTVSLTDAAGYASPQLSQLFMPGNEFWNNQIAVSMPILSFSTYGQIEQAKGAYYAAYYNYIQTVRAAFAAVDNDLSAHDKFAKSLVTQFKNYDSSKLAYDLAKISYEKGLYSYPTLLTNKVTMDNAAILVAQSKIAQLNTIVKLYQDLAGGYMVNESATLTKINH